MSNHIEAMNRAEQDILNLIDEARKSGLSEMVFNPQPVWYTLEIKLRLQHKGYGFKTVDNERIIYWY